MGTSLFPDALAYLDAPDTCNITSARSSHTCPRKTFPRPLRHCPQTRSHIRPVQGVFQTLDIMGSSSTISMRLYISPNLLHDHALVQVPFYSIYLLSVFSRIGRTEAVCGGDFTYIIRKDTPGRQPFSRSRSAPQGRLGRVCLTVPPVGDFPLCASSITIWSGPFQRQLQTIQPLM